MSSAILSRDELQEYLLEVGHYHPGRPGRFHPRTWDDGVMPLWEFGQNRLGPILDACERRNPPQQWISAELCAFESRAWYEWHWSRGRKLYRDPSYTPRSRRHISDAIRHAVYARDGHACLHCGATSRLSLDHIYPYSLGGEDTLDNLQTLCRPCNSRKGARVDGA